MNINATSAISLNSPAAPNKKQEELKGALEDFEAMFASNLLRTARESSGDSWLGGESSGGSDGIMEFAEQHIAKSMAKQGAFGIAKALSKSIRTA